jgi:serine protease Do
MNSNKVSKYGVAGAVLALAVAGGYMANASGIGISSDPRAVNGRPIPTAAAPGGSMGFADIVERVAPAVVSIDVEGKATPASFTQDGGDQGDGGGIPPELRRFFQQLPQGPGGGVQAEPMHGAGSGFFISADGYVATNNHVVDGADKITVRTADKRTFTARVIGRDTMTDIAVLKVNATNLPFVSFEDSAKPRVGDWVVAVGNPFGLGGTATAGIVSALDRQNVSDSRYVDFMQIDAPINRGNSGGPTFDLNGRVVGINTAIYSPSGGGSVGIGFDIPADVAAQVTKQLIAGGKVSRGYIGAMIQDVTPEIADSLGVDTKGALVADVTPGGPAQTAGLRSGDLVLRIDGKDVSGASDLTRRVGMAKAGGALDLDIRRDGRPMKLTVRPGDRPSEEKLAANDSPKAGADGVDPASSVLGMQLAPDAKGEGVRVAGVARGSKAAELGLRTGDVIVRAGDRATRSADDLAQAVKAAQASGRKQVLLLVARNGQRTFLPVEIVQG